MTFGPTDKHLLHYKGRTHGVFVVRPPPLVLGSILFLYTELLYAFFPFPNLAGQAKDDRVAASVYFLNTNKCRYRASSLVTCDVWCFDTFIVFSGTSAH